MPSTRLGINLYVIALTQPAIKTGDLNRATYQNTEMGRSTHSVGWRNNKPMRVCVYVCDSVCMCVLLSGVLRRGARNDRQLTGTGT